LIAKAPVVDFFSPSAAAAASSPVPRALATNSFAFETT
jgi:hypothetical protein